MSYLQLVTLLVSQRLKLIAPHLLLPVPRVSNVDLQHFRLQIIELKIIF